MRSRFWGVEMLGWGVEVTTRFWGIEMLKVWKCWGQVSRWRGGEMSRCRGEVSRWQCRDVEVGRIKLLFFLLYVTWPRHLWRYTDLSCSVAIPALARIGGTSSCVHMHTRPFQPLVAQTWLPFNRWQPKMGSAQSQSGSHPTAGSGTNTSPSCPTL